MAALKSIYHYFLAAFFYWFYGRPSRRLIVVGVTGTKGKSTTCRLIAGVLEAGGYKVGLLSTAEFQIGDRRWLNNRKMTMLGRGEIHKMLRDMVRAGCRYAVVETSSEGILQYRHKFLNYDIAVFTNLGTEHNERHGGFENLKRDKGKMFAELNRTRKIFAGQKIHKIIIANADDGHAPYFLAFAADKKYTHSLVGAGPNTAENIKAEKVSADGTGVSFSIGAQQYRLNLAGEFNVPNALAAIAVGRSQNIPEERIVSGLASVQSIPGRMEFIDEGQDFKVIVDYAHEPMSYAALFTALRRLAGPLGRIIALIGSDGGGRDVGKRRQMGQVAGELCDVVIVTDVNCFDEDPRAIAEMLAGGARGVGKKDNSDLFIESDRRKAIELAIKMARSGDVVVLTAKGNEPCIIVAGGKKIPWDDRTVAREVLRRR